MFSALWYTKHWTMPNMTPLATPFCDCLLLRGSWILRSAAGAEKGM